MTAHVPQLQRRLEAMAQLRNRLSQLLVSMGTADSPFTKGPDRAHEEMTMLDATVQKRISILVYADLESAFDYLVGVFGLGPPDSWCIQSRR